MTILEQFFFRSEMFRVELGEDEESNPFCYGRQLGRWLKARFAERGYTPEEVFAEDWGWCVMLSREDGRLWLACGTIARPFTGKSRRSRRRHSCPRQALSPGLLS